MRIEFITGHATDVLVKNKSLGPGMDMLTELLIIDDLALRARHMCYPESIEVRLPLNVTKDVMLMATSA